MSAHRNPSRLLAVGTLLALAVVGTAGCGAALFGETREDHRNFDLTGDRLVIEVGSADVGVEPGDSDQIEVDRRIHGNAAGDNSWEMRDDTLRLTAACRGIAPGCGADYTVRLPEGATVLEIRSGDGDVRTSELAQDQNIRTGHGDVSVEDSSGPLRLVSGNGDIEVRDAGPPDLNAETSNGDVTVALTAAPERVELTSANGDIEFALPDGDETYGVDVRSNHGDVSSTIEDDPGADRVIRIETANGQVRLRTA